MKQERAQRVVSHKTVIMKRMAEREHLSAFAIDVSRSGVLVHTDSCLNVGDRLSINMTCFRNGRPLTMNGTCEVVRCGTDTQVGMRFLHKFVSQ